MSVLLEVAGVSKRFGGLQALEDVSFTIAPREIYGLIGPNATGKTTPFNLLTGVYAPNAGSFRFDGRSLDGLAPHQIAAAGIARTFQNIRLFANLSALENVMIGRHVRTRAGVIGAVLRNPRTLREAIRPQIAFRVEVLPAPFAPIRQTSSPSAISSSTPATARMPP